MTTQVDPAGPMSNSSHLIRVTAYKVCAAILGALLSIQSTTAQPATDPQTQQPIKAVLELFTSQGCSSCPRADGLMESTFSKRPDVLALSFSVDYWDYIGWKDTNASPLNSARQRDYARTRGDGAVYTPQMVVNGRAHVVGSQTSDIDRAVLKTASQTSDDWIALTVRSTSTGIRVDAQTGEKSSLKDSRLLLVGIKRRHEVKIDRGENAGRSITYTNVVRQFRAVATGAAATSTTVATWSIATDQLVDNSSDAYAVVLQRGTGGPIIGAAKIGVW
jgi:hypothetical protein